MSSRKTSAPLKGLALRPLWYLDTARLGRMVPLAQQAHHDFVRLAAEEPSSLYFEEFLRHGYRAWPTAYQRQYPGLSVWEGVQQLKTSLLQLSGAAGQCRVRLASCSLPLLKRGLDLLFRNCRNVLTTDLSWPAYQKAITARAHRTDKQVSITKIRNWILRNAWTGADVADYLAAEFSKRKCDGLFLPAVDHLGVRLPIGEIVRHIRAIGDLKFVVVDAAQAFGHVALDEVMAHANYIVAGCHKWLGAYLPLGVAFYNRRRYRRQHQARRNRNDPLGHFVEQLDRGNLVGQSQTVNLSNLFTAAGAVRSRQVAVHGLADEAPDVDARCARLRRLSDDWSRISVAPEFQTRIALLERTKSGETGRSADQVREEWLNAGCIVTGYDGGLARLSFCPGVR